MMLGRTRLYQRTGSPLIRGLSGVRRRRWWPWLVALIVVSGLAWAYVTYLR
jgi:hypothetical protein